MISNPGTLTMDNASAQGETMQAGANIMQILDKDYPSDPRVTQEVESTQKLGIPIYVVYCPGEKSRPVDVPGVTLIPVKGVAKRGNFLASRALSMFNLGVRSLTCGFHLAEKGPLIVHCNDFVTLPIGVALKRLLGKRVRLVYDSHEWSPGLYEFFVGRGFSTVVKVLERALIRQADMVFSTNQVFGGLIQSNYGKSVVVINNWPRKVDVADPVGLRTRMRTLFNVGRDDFVIGYVGSMLSDRALFEFLDALKILPERASLGRTLKVLLVGGGPALSEIQRQTVELGLEGTVKAIGQVSRQEAMNSYYAFDLAYCVYKVGPHSVSSSPWKVTEAINSGVPVLVVKGTTAAETVEKNRLGWVTKSSEPEDIAEALQAAIEEKMPFQPTRMKNVWEERLVQDSYLKVLAGA